MLSAMVGFPWCSVRGTLCRMSRRFRSVFDLMLALGLLCTLGGCANQLTKQQQMWLAQGQECYERNDYAGAIQQLNYFLREVSEGPEVAQALYVRGMSNAQAGHRQQAYEDLRRCVTVPSRADIAWRTYFVLGTLHFEDEQWSLAAESLRAAADRMAAEPPKDLALFRLGLCRERMGQWQAALNAYTELVRTFGSGVYVAAAQRRLELRADHFAIQCGAFRERANAETLRADLNGKALDAYIQEEFRGRTAMYIVLVGRYASYDDARAQLAMIKQQFVPDALLWP
jgi:tetratricopeptide (TPR) repeat protein